MKRAQILLLATLLALLPFLAACAGTHDSIYDDAAALAGADVYETTIFLGKQSAPDTYEFSANALSGARTVWRYTIREGQHLTVHCDLNETGGGQVKLILVAPDGSVATLLEASKDRLTTSHTFETMAGEYRIKVVGKGNVQAGAVIQMEGATGAFGTE